MSPYASGKGPIPFGNAYSCHITYDYMRLDFDVDEFRQHLATVLEVAIGINTYVPPEERTEMTTKYPQSKPNPVAIDYVTTLCITKLSK
ncbi:unnamed protein product [Prunus armeniaca]